MSQPNSGLDFHAKRRNATERDSQTWQIHFVQDRPDNLGVQK